MQGQALISWTNASLATTLATAEISMFSSPLFQVVLPVLWENSTFSIVLITLDSLESYFQYFNAEKQFNK